jgi:hypothetical protein
MYLIYQHGKVASQTIEWSIRRLGAVLRKEIFDIYAAIPSSWNTPRMAA